MKRRARQTVIIAAVLVALVVGALVVANWDTVREHVEVWHFLLTKETEEIEPNPAWETQSLETRRGFRRKLTRRERVDLQQDVDTAGIYDTECILQVLANSSGRPVIFSLAAVSQDDSEPTWLLTAKWMSSATAVGALNMLKLDGWRVIEQRFPRKVYVLIREGPSRRRRIVLKGGSASVGAVRD
jgi:hypothetical protein